MNERRLDVSKFTQAFYSVILRPIGLLSISTIPRSPKGSFNRNRELNKAP